MVCLEKLNEMPAGEWEKGEIKEEGIRISPSWGPLRIITENGKLTGMECRKCADLFDKEGGFRPVYNEEVTRIFDGETVIVAIGQSPDIDFLKGLKTWN